MVRLNTVNYFAATQNKILAGTLGRSYQKYLPVSLIRAMWLAKNLAPHSPIGHFLSSQEVKDAGVRLYVKSADFL